MRLLWYHSLLEGTQAWLGTKGGFEMADSRVRLTERHKALIATALRQYRSGKVSKELAREADQLISRMVDSVPGNPRWIAGDK